MPVRVAVIFVLPMRYGARAYMVIPCMGVMRTATQPEMEQAGGGGNEGDDRTHNARQQISIINSSLFSAEVNADCRGLVLAGADIKRVQSSSRSGSLLTPTDKYEAALLSDLSLDFTGPAN